MNTATDTNPARILATITADLAAAALTGDVCATFAGLEVSFVSGNRMVISGEGATHAKTAGAIFRSLSGAFAGVTTGTDKFEDYVDGIYTCVWLDLDAAIAA